MEEERYTLEEAKVIIHSQEIKKNMALKKQRSYRLSCLIKTSVLFMVAIISPIICGDASVSIVLGAMATYLICCNKKVKEEER